MLRFLTHCFPFPRKGRDAALEGEILEWIAAMTGKVMPEKAKYEDFLGDGLVLCELINKLRPGSVKKVSKGSGNFAKMENVAAFTKGVTVSIDSLLFNAAPCAFFVVFRQQPCSCRGR